MEIVITNDDGWGSQGILALTDIMRTFGHVTVVAPDGARSGYSNAITSDRPMSLRRVNDPQRQDADIYISSGTPSDCIKLALNVLFKGDEKAIDLIVSGINHGSNASINTIYSGTLGACLIAAEHDIPSIAFSIDDHNNPTDLSHFTALIPDMVRHLQDIGWRLGMCYNVNAPQGPVAGIRWTRQAKGRWYDEIEQRGTNEQGEPIYWLTGAYRNDEPEATDTDQYAMSHGFISIQPCKVDLTDYEAL